MHAAILICMGKVHLGNIIYAELTNFGSADIVYHTLPNWNKYQYNKISKNISSM